MRLCYYLLGCYENSGRRNRHSVANHSVEQLVRLLKPQGKLIVVGVPDKPLEMPPISLVSVN